MANVTEIAQAWHDDGDDKGHVIAKTANEIYEATIEEYGLELTANEEATVKMILLNVVENSIDWQKIADDDDNARSYAEAKRSALYK